MKRFFIHLAYNGSRFHGWQVQPNVVSVQEVIERALSLLLKIPIGIVGCGRTDTGVHALHYFAHFDMDSDVSVSDCTLLTQRLNSFFNEDIVIYNVFEVPETAHARFDAVSRTYQYHIALRKNPFKQEFSHRVFTKLDIEKMNTACEVLFEYDDFTSFSKVHTQTKTNLCTIRSAFWEVKEDELIFTIQANRFLRNMVRAITGTLIEVGRGKITIDEFHEIIRSKNRSEAGTSLPAKALFLTEVLYPSSLFIMNTI